MNSLAGVNHMLGKLSFRIMAIASLTLLLAIGCSKTPDEPIRFGSNPWIGYEPIYLARSLGYTDPKQVKFVEYLSATQTMRGLSGGSIEVAGLTLDEALHLYEQGVDIKILLAMDYSAGADALVVKPEINSLADLRGKRIAAETSALGAYMVHRILEKGGLELKDIQLIRYDISKHEEAYVSGEVDGVVTFDPVRIRLIRHGGKVLLDSNDLPEEIVDVMVVRTDALQHHQSQIYNLIYAWFRSLDYIEQQPELASTKISPRAGLSADDVLQGFDVIKFPDEEENREMLLGATAKLKIQADNLSKIMLKNKLLSSEVDSSQLFDSAILGRIYH